MPSQNIHKTIDYIPHDVRDVIKWYAWNLDGWSLHVNVASANPTDI